MVNSDRSTTAICLLSYVFRSLPNVVSMNEFHTHLKHAMGLFCLHPIMDSSCLIQLHNSERIQALEKFWQPQHTMTIL